ncbi:MAG: response regulator [Pseudomonadota bacterium]
MRLLYAEDDPGLARLLQKKLERLGYVVDVAGDGPQSLSMLESGSYDVLALDHNIPGITGLEVIRTLATRGRLPPTIMITGAGDERVAVEALKLGADDYIIKDPQAGYLDLLPARIRQAIDKNRLKQEKERAEAALRRINEELEQRIHEAVADLVEANRKLEEEVVERRKAQEALRQSEHRYRSLVEGSFDGIYIRNGTRILFANRRMQEMLLYPEEELTALDPWEIYHPEDRSLVRRIEADRPDGKTTADRYEVRLRRKDGSILRGEVDSRFGTLNDEPVVQICVRDITERWRAEEERLRLATALEQSADTILITDTCGTILYANPAFEKNTGYAREEAVGMKAGILKSGRHEDSFYRKMWGALKKGETWKGRFINRKKDGSLFHEETTIAPVKNQAGLTVNYVAIKRDVTKDIALESEMRQGQKMQALGTLAGGIAHDFNNILQVISGYTELTLERTDEGSIVHGNLRQILSATWRAGDLVHQILTFCRQKEHERRPTAIGPIVKETLKFMRASIPAFIEIRHRIFRGLGRIMADPTDMHRLIMNMCSNAAYAMKERGGILEVTMEEVSAEGAGGDAGPDKSAKGHVRLTVSDTGHGMEPEIVQRMFDPYFTTKEPGEGTGLGMSVVLGIVEAHEGTISVASEPGKGTVFTLTFPVIEDGPLALKEPVTDHSFDESIRILVVDDEPAVLKMMSEMLEQMGHKVDQAGNGAEGLDMFLKNGRCYDLVVTDLTMPEMTGVRLAEEISRTGAGVPVILCSGFEEKGLDGDAGSTGIFERLAKPVSKRDLADAIRRASAYRAHC